MEEVDKKYGLPLYGAGWVPAGAVKSILTGDDGGGDHQPSAEGHVVLSGGGGEGSSGIGNALLIVKLDPHSNSLSDQPVARLETGKDLPYRIALHPGQDGLICSFPESCRWYEWSAAESDDVRSLDLRSSENILNHLEGVGQQLALAFSSEGSLLATGGEDGRLRVFKWPSMEIILSEDKAHTSVKNLHFSLDGKFLVTVGSGPVRIWDLTTLTAVSSLPKGKDEIFCFCKFSGSRDDNQELFVVTMRGQDAIVSKWSTTSWMKISSKRVVRDPVCSFDVSPDGNLLALGTIQGDLLVLSSKTMKVRTLVKKAHLGLLTALSFSRDSRHLLSASMDSSARVTEIKDEKTSKWWMIFLIIFFAIVAYIFQDKDLLQQVLDYQRIVLLKAGIAL